MSYFVPYKRAERSKGLIFFPFLFAFVKLLFPSMSLYQESNLMSLYQESDPV